MAITGPGKTVLKGDGPRLKCTRKRFSHYAVHNLQYFVYLANIYAIIVNAILLNHAFIMPHRIFKTLAFPNALTEFNSKIELDI